MKHRYPCWRYRCLSNVEYSPNWPSTMNRRLNVCNRANGFSTKGNIKDVEFGSILLNSKWASKATWGRRFCAFPFSYRQKKVLSVEIRSPAQPLLIELTHGNKGFVNKRKFSKKRTFRDFHTAINISLHYLCSQCCLRAGYWNFTLQYKIPQL